MELTFVRSGAPNARLAQSDTCDSENLDSFAELDNPVMMRDVEKYTPHLLWRICKHPYFKVIATHTLILLK